jgi:hypothetical protein
MDHQQERPDADQTADDGLSAVLRAAAATTSLSRATATSERALAEQVDRALSVGRSWDEVAGALGITRRVARERFDPEVAVQG